MNSIKAVVVQSPHSPAKNFSCVLRTQVGNRSTICLLINEDEIRINTLIDRLRGRRKLLEKSPLYFIILLVEDYGYANEKLRESLDQSIFDMECYIRTASFYMGALDENSEALQTLIVKLQVTKNRLVWLDCTTNFELELGTFSQEMIELYENLRRVRKLDIRSKPDRILLSQETNFHQNACRFRRYQAQGLQQRVQTQINIVSPPSWSQKTVILTPESSTAKSHSETTGSTSPLPEIPEKSPKPHKKTVKS